jgi:hypothetical protein
MFSFRTVSSSNVFWEDAIVKLEVVVIGQPTSGRVYNSKDLLLAQFFIRVPVEENYEMES